MTVAGPRGRHPAGAHRDTPGATGTTPGGAFPPPATAEVRGRRIARLRKQLDALTSTGPGGQTGAADPATGTRIRRIRAELDRLTATAPGRVDGVPTRVTGGGSGGKRPMPTPNGNRHRTTWRPAEGVTTASRAALRAGIHPGERASDVEITAPIGVVIPREPPTGTRHRFTADPKRPGSVPVSRLLHDVSPPVTDRDPDHRVTLGPPARRRVNLRRTAVVGVVVVVVLGVAVFALTPLILRISQQPVEQVSHRDGGLTSAGQPAVNRVNLAQPFARTPAANLAEGPDGIITPPAAPVGAIPAERVNRATERVREAIAAARLNPGVLNGDHEPYLSLLAPNARSGVQRVLATGPGPRSANYVSSLAPGTRLLSTRPTRTGGAMTTRLDANGALVVKADYVVAYAFDPGDHPVTDPLDMVVLERWQAEYTVLDDRWSPEDQGLWPGPARAFGYSISCPAYARGQLAPVFSNGNATGGLPRTDSYFNLAQPLPAADGCGGTPTTPAPPTGSTVPGTTPPEEGAPASGETPGPGDGGGRPGERAPVNAEIPTVDDLLTPPPPGQR